MPKAELPAAFHDAVKKSTVMNAGYVAEAERRMLGLAVEHRAFLGKNLEDLAKKPATPQGVADALALLADQMATFPVDKAMPQREGATFGAATMKYAGRCVIHGLLAEAARAADDAQAALLLKTVRSSPVVDDAEQGLLSDEIEEALGDERYGLALDSVRA